MERRSQAAQGKRRRARKTAKAPNRFRRGRPGSDILDLDPCGSPDGLDLLKKMMCTDSCINSEKRVEMLASICFSQFKDFSAHDSCHPCVVESQYCKLHISSRSMSAEV